MNSADQEGRPGYHHGDLRRALLDAALRWIATKGVTGLSLRAVAREAGVSHAAPYHHFADRTALLAAVAEEGFRAMHSVMLARMRDAADPRVRLQESGFGYVQFVLEHPAHFRVMFSPEFSERSPYPEVQAAAAAAYRVLVDAITDCQKSGFVRPADPELLGRAAWALVHGVATLVLDGHFSVVPSWPHAEGHVREAMAILWQGLVHPAERWPAMDRGKV